MSVISSLSPRAVAAPESGIVEVVNYARGREGLLPLWVGEGDLPTPDFISRAAMASLEAGETFYTYQRGIPELRQALSDYYGRHFAQPLSPDHFFVTGSGMQAIQIGVQALTAPGDEMVYLIPAWPNISAALEIGGARAIGVAMTFRDGGWHVDLESLDRAITPKTRGIFVNTPSNPTGWTASREDLQAILALARRRGIWIMADEIYARYYFGASRAPSFLDVMEPQDRILFVNSFSKNWSMTGWRIGWIVATPEMGQVLENLVQYSTSGVAQFIQRGAVEALDRGDHFVEANIDRARRSRDILCDALIATNRVEMLKPEGAIYAFFKIDGVSDSRKAALDIVDKIGVGLAPGSAFGAGGERFLRACFLRDPDQVAAAAGRLHDYILSL